MARYKIKRKEVTPDPKFESKQVAKFINHVMEKGKKETAKKIVYQAFEDIEKKKKGEEPIEVFKRAIHNVKPSMEVRSKRVGGANYQVPYRVPEERGITLAMRWIIRAARKNKNRPMYEKLAQEIMLAAESKGEAMQRRFNVHRMAQANKAFAYLAR